MMRKIRDWILLAGVLGAGTIRKRFGTDIGENACHGSDAPETAAFEVGYFFPGYELPSPG